VAPGSQVCPCRLSRPRGGSCPGRYEAASLPLASRNPSNQFPLALRVYSKWAQSGLRSLREDIENAISSNKCEVMNAHVRRIEIGPAALASAPNAGPPCQLGRSGGCTWTTSLCSMRPAADLEVLFPVLRTLPHSSLAGQTRLDGGTAEAATLRHNLTACPASIVSQSNTVDRKRFVNL
jgi:hypothetical protein